MRTRTVRVNGALSVEIADDGAVFWGGERIGYVWKGHRTYSPPMYKGSRVARFHRQVPEWHGHTAHSGGLPQYRRDTRKAVLFALIAAHRQAA